MKLTKSKLKAISALPKRVAGSFAGVFASATLIYTTILLVPIRPTLADEMFDNRGIQFDEDTIVDFEFIQSHGAYQSSFGVINLDTGEKTPLLVEVKPADTDDTVRRESTYQDDFESQRASDFLGTPGNTVIESLASFTFKAGNRYILYLESTFNNQLAGIVYSTNLENLGQNQQTQFVGGLPELGDGGVILRWDDTGSKLVLENEQDNDYDDFIIGVGGNVKCPYASGQ